MVQKFDEKSPGLTMGIHEKLQELIGENELTELHFQLLQYFEEKGQKGKEILDIFFKLSAGYSNSLVKAALDREIKLFHAQERGIERPGRKDVSKELVNEMEEWKAEFNAYQEMGQLNSVKYQMWEKPKKEKLEKFLATRSKPVIGKFWILIEESGLAGICRTLLKKK